MIQLEICLSGIESAVAAQLGGADRIELCENLLEGGTTPSFGLIARVAELLDIDIMVMIRPRGGDFLYSADEFAVMLADVQQLQNQRVSGAVFGVLLPDGRVDVERCKRFIVATRPLTITFHRAFDMTRDPFEALDTLLELGVDRILTSGQAKTAVSGIPLIKKLQAHAGDALRIMPAVGISAQNVRHILDETNVRDIHVGTAVSTPTPSQMRYQPAQLDLDQQHRLTSAALVQQLVEQIRSN